MKKSIYTAFASLALMGSAQAAPLVACDHCEYMRPVRNLGVYSQLTGYRGTFQNLDIVADLAAENAPGVGGNGRQFDNYYVFDVVVDSQVTLIVRTQRSTALAGPWGVQLFLDPGVSCGWETCTLVYPDDSNAIFTEPNLTTGLRITRTLAAGRYMIRVAAGTRSTGESGYTATIVTRPLQ